MTKKRRPRENGSNGPRERSRNLKQSIYQQLRERIVFMEMKPGEFVNETRLALELGVSRTVLREILQRLIADGLLTATPGQGVYVQGLDLVMIKNAYEMRIPLEGLAGRMAAERARPEDLQQLRTLLGQGDALVAAKDYRGMARLDWNSTTSLAKRPGTICWRVPCCACLFPSTGCGTSPWRITGGSETSCPNGNGSWTRSTGVLAPMPSGP